MSTGANYKNNTSARDREAYIKQIESEATLLLNSTQEKIPDFMSPTQYQSLLGLFARFHRYSYINIILIFMQYSKATHIAGFETWKTICLDTWGDPERQILKQEHKGKGIRLLAPYTYARSMEDRRLIHFIVSVYDISQTNNLPPLEQDEEYVLQAKTNHLLSALRFVSPYRIIVAGRENELIDNGLEGYCDHSNQFIILNEDLKGNKLLAETIRQIVLAESTDYVGSNKQLLDLIVESVAYIFDLHFGVQRSEERYNFSFIERYAGATQKQLAEALNIVQLISHKLIETVEIFLQEMSEFDSFDCVDEDALYEFKFEGVLS